MVDQLVDCLDAKMVDLMVDPTVDETVARMAED
jgi:hypothetical protein